jgi:hypothetical protein
MIISFVIFSEILSIFIFGPMKYCTYLTIYSGNKLPPFYIGSTVTSNVINKNYHGSVTSKKYSVIWKSELKNNPLAFKTKIIAYHESLDKARENESKLQRAFNVIQNPMYINLNISGIKFPKNLCGINNHFYGKHHSDETKRILSISSRNRLLRSNPMNNPEYRKRVSQAKSLNWIVTFPDGSSSIVNNLYSFCKSHNINMSNLTIHGKSKGFSVTRVL